MNPQQSADLYVRIQTLERGMGEVAVSSAETKTAVSGMGQDLRELSTSIMAIAKNLDARVTVVERHADRVTFVAKTLKWGAGFLGLVGLGSLVRWVQSQHG